MADLREAKLVMEEKRREEQDKKNEEREKQEKAKVGEYFMLYSLPACPGGS